MDRQQNEVPKSMSRVEKITAYENGDMDEESTIDLFQELVDSGLAWQLQGHYGRQAQRLIEAGLIQAPV